MQKSFLNKIREKRPYLIGMVHLAPLIIYSNTPGPEEITKLALKDARVLAEAGFDAILVENNYDLPHTEFITPSAKEEITKIVQEIKKNFGVQLQAEQIKINKPLKEVGEHRVKIKFPHNLEAEVTVIVSPQ